MAPKKTKKALSGKTALKNVFSGKFTRVNAADKKNLIFESTSSRPSNQRGEASEMRVLKLNQKNLDRKKASDRMILNLAAKEKKYKKLKAIFQLIKPKTKKVVVKKLDMAHAVSINEIRTVLNHLLTYDLIKESQVKKHLEDFLTDSDEDDTPNDHKTSRKNFRGNIENLITHLKNSSFQNAMSELDTIVARLNRTRGNLLPGDSSVNQSLGEKRDRHKVFTAKNLNKKLPKNYVERRFEIVDQLWDIIENKEKSISIKKKLQGKKRDHFSKHKMKSSTDD